MKKQIFTILTAILGFTSISHSETYFIRSCNKQDNNVIRVTLKIHSNNNNAQVIIENCERHMQTCKSIGPEIFYNLIINDKRNIAVAINTIVTEATKQSSNSNLCTNESIEEKAQNISSKLAQAMNEDLRGIIEQESHPGTGLNPNILDGRTHIQ